MSETLQYHKGGLIFASLADAYIEKGMFDDAIKLLKEGITLHPDYGYAHRLLGICYFRIKDPARAEIELKQALKDPEDIKTRFYLAKTYLLQDRIEEARKLSDEINRIAPDCEEAKSLNKEFERPTEEQITEQPETVIDVESTLKELTSLSSIDGVLLTEKDGLLIAAQGVDNADEMSGLISGIANQCWLTGSEFGIGDLMSFSITLTGENLINIIGPDAILTIISKTKGQEGLAALYSARFYNRIKEILEQ